MSQTLHPYFRLSGEFDPDEITRILEIEPSWVARIGDPGPPDAVGPRKGALWVWQPDTDDSNDIGDQLAFLAGSLSQKGESVAKLTKKFDGTFYVFNEVGEARAEWFVSSRVIRLIADLRVDIQGENIGVTRDKELCPDAN